MKSCVLILPYFGKFPNYFPLFLNSVAKNNSIDLLLFTDNECLPKLPPQVRVIQESFMQFKERFQRVLGPEIHLESPYKLCDYKPMYGYVLREFLTGYPYWGHCDCDLLFGNLDRLLTPLLNKGYDKLFAAGHLTLYKNTEENNTVFMKSYQGKSLYREATSTDDIVWFDEDYKEDNVHAIFLQEGRKVFTQDLSINPNIDASRWALKKYSPDKRTFVDVPYRGEQYYWQNGNLLQVKRVGDRLEQQQYLYMHFQLRSMKCGPSCVDASILKIVPNRFLPVRSVPITLRDWKKERKFYFYPQKLALYVRKIRKVRIRHENK